MKLKDYLNEQVSTNMKRLNFKNKKNLEIPEGPNVILAGDKPKPTNTVMIYVDESGQYVTMDSKGLERTFSSVENLAKALSTQGFVYFEGYNRF